MLYMVWNYLSNEMFLGFEITHFNKLLE